MPEGLGGSFEALLGILRLNDSLPTIVPESSFSVCLLFCFSFILLGPRTTTEKLLYVKGDSKAMPQRALSCNLYTHRHVRSCKKDNRSEGNCQGAQLMPTVRMQESRTLAVAVNQCFSTFDQQVALDKL